MDEERKEETLKTLIRYIIGDSLKKKKIFFGQKQFKILTKKKKKIWSKTMKNPYQKKKGRQNKGRNPKNLNPYLL